MRVQAKYPGRGLKKPGRRAAGVGENIPGPTRARRDGNAFPCPLNSRLEISCEAQTARAFRRPGQRGLATSPEQGRNLSGPGKPLLASARRGYPPEHPADHSIDRRRSWTDDRKPLLVVLTFDSFKFKDSIIRRVRRVKANWADDDGCGMIL